MWLQPQAYRSGGWEIQDQGAGSLCLAKGLLIGLQVAAFLLYPHVAK